MLEELSRRFFASSLPENWTCFEPARDYGVDLAVDIFDGSRATGHEFLVQLKASERPSMKNWESIILRADTYNYLWNKLQVVLLVKYIHHDNEAYWELLRNATPPTAGAKTVSIRIPKLNRVSTIDWTSIYGLVQQVTRTKLEAQRRRARRL